MENPKVSVIIPVYNAEKYLCTCLNSVVNQTLREIEIICVDDGSTDGSIEILQNYANQDERIKIFSQKNSGAGSARNTGIQRSTGEYITFLDSDDYVNWDLYECAFHNAVSTDADIIVYGGISFPTTTKWVDNKLSIKQCEYHNDSINALIYENSSRPFIWNKLYKRQLIADNNLLFPEIPLGEDQAWLFLVFPKAEHIIYIPGRFYHYRQNSEGSAMIKFLADKELKLDEHKKIVDFVYDKWKEEGYLSKYGQHWADWCLNFFGNDLLHTSYVQARSLGKLVVERTIPYREYLNRNTKKILDGLNALTPEYVKIEPLNPTVSVIISVYNAQKYLTQCLESILKQTFTDFELICVDNGTTDESLQILYKYADVDKRIKVLIKDNYCETIAKGKYYLFLDTDVFYDIDMLEKVYGRIVKYDADICVFGSDIYDEALKEFQVDLCNCNKGKVPQNTVFSRKTNNRNIYQFTNASSWNKLFRKDFLEQHRLRLQPTKDAADALVLLALSLAEKLIVLPEVLVHYRKYVGDNFQYADKKILMAFYDSMISLKNVLSKHGIYQEVEASFKNYVLNTCLYTLDTSRNQETFKSNYLFLRDTVFNELVLGDQTIADNDIYFESEILQKLEDIKAITPAEYGKKYSLPIFIQPKVSIILPSLNVADYIGESLKSAINQTLREIEIICVDAGSTDGTLDIIKDFMAKDARVRLINSPIKSYGYQMNIGISEARGEYIGIIETDDFVKPEMYKELYETAEEKQADFVKAGYYDFIMSEGVIKQKYVKVDASGKYCGRIINPAKEQEVFKLRMNTWTGVYKHSFLKDNDIRYNETPGAVYQDQGFWFKTFCCTKRAYFVNKAYYMYRRDNPNSSTFYNPSWVPNVVTEYNHIYEWLKDRNLVKVFKGPFASRKYYNLIIGFERTPDDKKLEYSYIIADEMAKQTKNGEYFKKYFSDNEWKSLQALVNNPADFYADTIKEKTKKFEDIKQKLRVSLSHEYALKNSISFRVGRAITWLPRKVRGGFRCYKQHGFEYTVKRLFWHVVHLK